MSYTTALNTGRESGVDKRMADFLQEHCGRVVHTLKYLIHSNKIYLSCVIAKIEGKKKEPRLMEEKLLMRWFKNITNLDLTKAISRERFKVPNFYNASSSPR